MPRVLMLARHFPPIGGAGVHRTVGSVRHLPAFGHEPAVVTGPGLHRDRWNPHDPGLLDGLPVGAEVHRLRGPEPVARTGAAARLDGLRMAPAPWVRWWVRESVRLGRQVAGDADVVLASCVPYETALAGARLAAELGVPWVADLEDPWALDEMRAQPSRAHAAIDRRRMHRVLGSASAVVMAAPEAAARLRAARPELAVAGVPIGYEPDDFAVPAAPRRDRAFRIVHTGSMHTDFGLHLRRTAARRRLLGGTFPGVDVLTRSPVFLIEAIAADPALAGRVELHLAGELSAIERALAERHPFVRVAGLLPHRETIALMRSADLLFLPMQDLPRGVRAGLIPYKTYEYLAAGRPILAAVPDGDVRDMLAPLPQATLVRPADVAAMTAALRARVAVAPEPDTAPPAAYERVRAVERIAAILDGVLGRRAAVPALAA
jgi:hypothetical protein